MIFGNKNDFAIEAMVEPGLQAPSSLWGRMCIWVGGVSIGDIDDPNCGLLPAYDGFREVCNDLNTLWSPKFDSMGDVEIWNFLDGLLYGCHGDIEVEDDRSLEQMQSDWREFGRFNFLTNWGEMFDRGGKSFLLKIPEGKLRVLNLHLPFNNQIGVNCTEFSFRKASSGFINWHSEQEIALGSKNA